MGFTSRRCEAKVLKHPCRRSGVDTAASSAPRCPTSTPIAGKDQTGCKRKRERGEIAGQGIGVFRDSQRTGAPCGIRTSGANRREQCSVRMRGSRVATRATQSLWRRTEIVSVHGARSTVAMTPRKKKEGATRGLSHASPCRAAKSLRRPSIPRDRRLEATPDALILSTTTTGACPGVAATNRSLAQIGNFLEGTSEQPQNFVVA